MTYGTFQGIITIIMMAIMIGIIFWSYSAKRKPRFDQAARSIFDDDTPQIVTRTEQSAESEK